MHPGLVAVVAYNNHSVIVNVISALFDCHSQDCFVEALLLRCKGIIYRKGPAVCLGAIQCGLSWLACATT
jgi:hypothetical protein